MKRERCCDLLACRDSSFCGCCLPTTTGDARRLKWVGVFIAVIALIFLLIGLFVPTAISNAFDNALTNSAIIAPDNAAFDLMASNHEFPMKLEMYIYNVTNPVETITGTKPNLQEIGPFVYWVYRDILPGYNFTKNETQFDYQYYERYVFDESLSIASDEVKIYQSNMPFWGTSSAFLKKEGFFVLDMFMDFLINGNEDLGCDQKDSKAYADPMNIVWAYRSVRETMFGYDDDPLMNCAHAILQDMFSPIYTGIIQNATSIEHARMLLPFNETISTGIDSRDKARNVVKYHGSDHIQDLEREACPWGEVTQDICLVRGIDGASTLPLTNQTHIDQGFDFWYPSLYRHLHFKFDHTYQEEGIDFYRFRFDPKEWQDFTLNPANTAYDMTISGVIPLAKALSNSPLSITRPRQLGVPTSANFYSNVDITLLQDGKRNPEDKWSMDTYFDMEKRSGSTLRFSSTSEMVISVGKVEYEYDPPGSFILTSDQLLELDQLVGSFYGEDDLNLQANNNSKLRQLMQKLTEDQTNPLSSQNSFLSTLSTTLPHGQRKQYNGELSQSCGFGPNAHHCAANPAFQTLMDMAAENRQILAPQQGDQKVHSIYLPDLLSSNVPFFWANQTGGINQHDLHALGVAFKAVDNTIKIIPLVCFPFALFLLLLGIFFMIRGSQYQNDIQEGAHTLDETHQDGSIKQQYGETLDALDLDPVYSNDYAHRSTNAASSLHISQGSRPQQHPQQYNRSYSTTSNSKKMVNRDRSFEPLSPGARPAGYGGVELKGPDYQ